MENFIRLGAALVIFAVMVGWEAIQPRRAQKVSQQQRWPVNLGLAFFNMLLMRFSMGALAYLSAVFAVEKVK